MRLGAAFIAIVASLCGSPALAEGGRLDGLGANLFGNSFFHFGAANLKSPQVSTIVVGRMRVELQHTKLAEIQRAFGGSIQQEGDGTGLAHWLCYVTGGIGGGAAKVWFMSNSLGGGEFIMMIAAQAVSSHESEDCDTAPAGFAIPQMGIPSLGATTTDLKAHFGSASVGSHSDISYRSDRPARDGLGTATDAQYLGYVVSHGVVTGVGVGETSAQ
jgi:hypothetical protein